jgi:hypothetical protein
VSPEVVAELRRLEAFLASCGAPGCLLASEAGGDFCEAHADAGYGWGVAS